MSKTVQFQTIQFNVSTVYENSSILNNSVKDKYAV